MIRPVCWSKIVAQMALHLCCSNSRYFICIEIDNCFFFAIVNSNSFQEQKQTYMIVVIWMKVENVGITHPFLHHFNYFVFIKMTLSTIQRFILLIFIMFCSIYSVDIVEMNWKRKPVSGDVNDFLWYFFLAEFIHSFEIENLIIEIQKKKSVQETLKRNKLIKFGDNLNWV